MKYLIIVLASIPFFFTSCANEGGENDGSSSVNTSKTIDLPINTCDYITKEMVLSRFDVKSEDLELKDDNNEKSSSYSQCGYIWKKANYDELLAIRTDMMMAYAMKGVNKNTEEVKMSDIIKLESPNNMLKIGHFKTYDDVKSAVTRFDNSHRVPTKKDMEKLHQEIDKSGEEHGLDEKSKKMGKKLTSGIGSSLKFTEVDGIGDKAYFDHLDKSLDVRFGKHTFSVFIDTENDFDTNIKMAKEIAQEVWDKL